MHTAFTHPCKLIIIENGIQDVPIEFPGRSGISQQA